MPLLRRREYLLSSAASSLLSRAIGRPSSTGVSTHGEETDHGLAAASCAFVLAAATKGAGRAWRTSTHPAGTLPDHPVYRDHQSSIFRPGRPRRCHRYERRRKIHGDARSPSSSRGCRCQDAPSRRCSATRARQGQPVQERLRADGPPRLVRPAPTSAALFRLGRLQRQFISTEISENKNSR